MTLSAVRAPSEPEAAAPDLGEAMIERVERALTDFLAVHARSLATVGPELDAVATAAGHFVLDSGKRLRPRFAYWGWRSVKDADAEDTALVPAAASLELLHACALVHDDLIDASATRRGRPATHTEFAALHRRNRWLGDAQEFGTAAAILIGDLLLAWADTMFATARLPNATFLATRAAFDRLRELVIAGEYLDVLVQTRGEYCITDALRVARFKTSTYTVAGPLQMGAAAAGASGEVCAALSVYGTAIGEAFQLRDDVLGVFGDPSRTGKPAGDDLREGKRTLLVAFAMQAASTVEAALLRRELGDRDMDEAALAALREVIICTGAWDRVERRIAGRAAEARLALQTDAISDQARAALESLAIASAHRHM